MSISKKLKDRRKELHLTMLQVAQKVGVSEATISRWESGDIANMRRDKIVSLANALQVSPSFVMDSDVEIPFENESKPDILIKYNQLNDTDKLRTEAYIDGLLENDIYKDTQAKVITFSNQNNNSNVKHLPKTKLIAQDTVHKTVVKPEDIN